MSFYILYVHLASGLYLSFANLSHSTGSALSKRWDTKNHITIPQVKKLHRLWRHFGAVTLGLKYNKHDHFGRIGRPPIIQNGLQNGAPNNYDRYFLIKLTPFQFGIWIRNCRNFSNFSIFGRPPIPQNGLQFGALHNELASFFLN